MTYLEAALKVIEQIEDNGYQAYFVGGFVRDYLLEKEPNDIDITTNALPHQIKNIFEVVNTGIKYNSVTVCYEGYRFETTTFRIDLSYMDNRHPVYKVGTCLTDDLKRRDFTINAMAMDRQMHVIDIFDGQKDLKKGIIRTVYEPSKRFTEDALRMLRACYFAAKLNFTIEKATLEAMKKCNYLVQYLSNDRVCWELEKLIHSEYPEKGIEYLVQTNIINYLPLFSEGIHLLNHSKIYHMEWNIFLGICFYNNPSKLLEMNFKATLRDEVMNGIECAKKCVKNDFTKILVFEYGEDVSLLANYINVYIKHSQDNELKIRELYASLPIHSNSDLVIKARDILELVEIKNPKDLKIILEDIKERVILGTLLNDKDEIENYIFKRYC